MAKRDKRKIATKIMICVLAVMMVFSVAASLIFSIIG